MQAPHALRFCRLLLPALPFVAACAAPLPPAAADLGNTRPVARIVEPITGTPGLEVELDGNSSYDPDGDELTWHWSFEQVPAGSELSADPFALNGSRNAASTAFVPDVVGVYTVALQVIDPLGAVSAVDFGSVVINLGGEPPVADAGSDRAMSEGSLVCLDGSGSSDPHGMALDWRWELVTTPPLSELVPSSLQGAFESEACFVPDAPGPYLLSLVVDNGLLVSDPAFVTVHASSTNGEPVAIAASEGGTACSTVTVDGSASSDPDGDAIAYDWHLLIAPQGTTTPLGRDAFDDSTAVTPSFYADLEGEYWLQLVVFDGLAWSEAEILVLDLGEKTDNTPPELDHTSDLYVHEEPLSCMLTCSDWDVDLDALGTVDPDGDTLKVTWEVVSGPATLSSEEGNETRLTVEGPSGMCINGLHTHTVTVRVTATDCAGGQDSELITARYDCF